MESTFWPPAHCAALRELLARGISHADAAKAINGRFGTDYSRSATLGRARRMRLSDEGRSKPQLSLPETLLGKLLQRRNADDFRPREFFRRPPVFAPEAPAPLRCVEIEPRHLALLELQRGDCRYPYGGDTDGEPITFCGHPRRKGSNYCAPHFHLTRGPDAGEESAAGVVPSSLMIAI